MAYPCIFFPKFHCELTMIKNFWGTMKHYLGEHCDYTFDALKNNMLPALRSVPITIIRKWINAYWVGLSAKDAQFKAKAFSSRKYTSHQRVPQTLAR
ncbi:hypothetical protein BDQ12DRAFT_699985 [Crucibulum laeve]|uniref:Uncharacterized protein n=1 Tax=Crucibulum laeve TaxID=68775 RepID=A0A5C3LS35_9AGAR|nr:hypothetical protein BDQ12DRAFT_699985 [Crucibulum laeve]